jgi:predicted RNA binding protein with dsRBD fold (UPF0201 family)
VKTTTKFLPGLSAKLQGRARRRQLETLRLLREKARSESISDLVRLILKRRVNHPGPVTQLKNPAANPMKSDICDEPFDPHAEEHL